MTEIDHHARGGCEYDGICHSRKDRAFQAHITVWRDGTAMITLFTGAPDGQSVREIPVNVAELDALHELLDIYFYDAPPRKHPRYYRPPFQK
jgi:hypothetical protein